MRPLDELRGPASSPEELGRQYEAYRQRQARRLLRLLPRPAIRPLYRSALDWAERSGAVHDPMAVLVQYCEQILPLPSFDVWVEDLTLHPVEHLHDLQDSAEAPSAGAPATMDARRFDLGDDPWVAHLRSFRDGESWRGFISFEAPRSGASHSTSVIFCEDDPVDLRDRFMAFDTDALEAFLRSALP